MIKNKTHAPASRVTSVQEDSAVQKPTHGTNSLTGNMDAREQQANGIANTLSDIFTVVIGNLEILQRLITDNPKALGRIGTALKSARRAIPLSEHFMGTAHKNPPNDGAPLTGDPAGKPNNKTNPAGDANRAGSIKGLNHE